MNPIQAANKVLKPFETLYLDTEFTGFQAPLLLSIALVGDGVEFYAEVTDTERIEQASEFVRQTVLPQFRKVPNATVSYKQLCQRLLTFLSQRVRQLDRGAYLLVAHDFDWDWSLLVQALQDADRQQAQALLTSVIAHPIAELTPQAQQRLSACFESARAAAVGRHHALCDARALQWAVTGGG